MNMNAVIFGREYSFNSIKEVLAKANEEKSGDILARIAAASAAERIAAKTVLSKITLEALKENPVIPYEEDEVTRVIIDMLDLKVYDKIKKLTVGEFREFLLKASEEDINEIRDGLTAEMISAVTKLMSNMDLVYVAKKINVTASCNTTIGERGTLASRLQPNHPTDDIEGVIASCMEGISYGVGDAVIGLNPANDTVDNVYKILTAFNDFIEEWKLPTQNCVLAHITTQMEALKKGAPMDLMFQSIAGSEKSNTAFGISVKLLDEAYELMKEKKHSQGNNFMYFETGQGSELSSEGNFDSDQLTMEARCYGLAKRYKPFLVNTVVGFIGPEYLYDGKQVIRAGLEDHFMGKLTGLPMGVDVCYTNHMKADQNDLESLAILLAAAECTYFMGIPTGDDVMLMYQSTSFHDIAAMRKIFGKGPIKVFENRMEELGIMKAGSLTEKAGSMAIFNKANKPISLSNLKSSTNARIDVGRAGDRYRTDTLLDFREDHAIAIDAVWSMVDTAIIDKLNFIKLQTLIKDKEEYIRRPDLGRRFSEETLMFMKQSCRNNIDVQIIAADGLSAPAITNNLLDVYSIIADGAASLGYSIGTPIFVKYGRVAAMDRISETLNAKVTILLVGERPGLATNESMSCYMAYEARIDKPESQRTVISNIHRNGMPPVEAGAQIVHLIEVLMREKKSGVELKI